MKYIDYKNMKDFYTIDEACRLFEMGKSDLQQYCKKYGINPVEDQFGNWGFPRKQLCKLHNRIYKQQRAQGWDRPCYNSSNSMKGPWE